MQIAVGALCLGDEADDLIHDFLQFGIFVHRIYGSHRFQPFVEVAIVEWRSVAFALFFSCCDEEVVVTMPVR